MKKIEKLARKLNDDFRDKLDAEMLRRYDLETKTSWHFGAGRLVTVKADGSDFTPEQMAFMTAFSDGYAVAMNMVTMESQF